MNSSHKSLGLGERVVSQTSNGSASQMMPDVICSAEDRASEEDAIKIFVLSVVKHYRDRPPIHLICPNATPAFEAWTRRFDRVTLDREPLELAYGCNQKPQTFERLFALGYRKPFWLDDDMVLGPTFMERLGRRLLSSCLVSEEPRISPRPTPEVLVRAHGWEVARALPRVINGGLILLSIEHGDLIAAWKAFLFSEEYRAAQKAFWRERPVHLYSDQEILTCLLCTKRFAHIPVDYLKEGEDIIQMLGPSGYLPGDRLRNAGAGPAPIVHSMGEKPWREAPQKGSSLRQRYLHLHTELSPYLFAAREVVGDEIDDFPWLKRRSFLGGVLRGAAGDNPALAGLPIAVVDVAVRRAKRLLNIDRIG